MKKLYTLIFILVPAIALVFAFTNGPSAGYTGSPIDGMDCTDCHLPGPATTAVGWITSDIPPIGYTPGQTYTITLSTVDANTSKMGFQITAETPGAKAGAFIITNASRTQLKGPSAVTHTFAGTDPIGTPNSWTMDWVAPVAGTGTLNFFAAVNASDADKSNEGDMIYRTQLTVNESNVGIAEQFDQSIGQIYPNPATDNVKLTVPLKSEVRVYDNIGRELLSISANNETMQLDVSAFKKGIYFVQIYLNGQVANRSFVKR